MSEKDWIDGPGLRAWLLHMVPHHHWPRIDADNPTLTRALNRWGAGGLANWRTADRHLTWLGLHLSEVPDELWRHDRRAQPRTEYAIEARRQAYVAADQGLSLADMAEVFGVSRETARRWKQEAVTHDYLP